MNKQQEALRLALEALERHAELGLLAGSTITAIREALADSALERMAENARELGLDYEPPCKTGSQCTSKCQQCEQSAQQQEPVAWRWTESNGQHWFDWRTDWTHHDRAKAMGFAIEYAYTSPPAAQQQEPVAVARVDDLERGGRVRALAMGLGLDAALYTSPQPAQPSKPLTDEQREGITAMWSRGHRNYTVGDIIDAVEAAHGIKGEA